MYFIRVCGRSKIRFTPEFVAQNTKQTEAQESCSNGGEVDSCAAELSRCMMYTCAHIITYTVHVHYKYCQLQ